MFVRDWPKDGLLKLSGLKNKVISSYLLLDKSKKLPVIQNGNQIEISVPEKPSDNPIAVLVLEIDGQPRIDPPLVSEQDTGIFKLNYLSAITHGKAMTRFNVKGKFHISKMTGPADSVNWIIHVTKPGAYRVNISYAANKEWEGSPFEISCGTSVIRTNVICTGDWYDYQDFPLGYLEFKSGGNYSIAIRPKKSMDTYLMYLNSITLSRVQKVKKEGWGVN
jgi:alpha-L-fucosidase